MGAVDFEKPGIARAALRPCRFGVGTGFPPEVGMNGRAHPELETPRKILLTFTASSRLMARIEQERIGTSDEDKQDFMA